MKKKKKENRKDFISKQYRAPFQSPFDRLLEYSRANHPYFRFFDEAIDGCVN
jgi:ribosomal protein S15P/S13E